MVGSLMSEYPGKSKCGKPFRKKWELTLGPLSAFSLTVLHFNGTCFPCPFGLVTSCLPCSPRQKLVYKSVKNKWCGFYLNKEDHLFKVMSSVAEPGLVGFSTVNPMFLS